MIAMAPPRQLNTVTKGIAADSVSEQSGNIFTQRELAVDVLTGYRLIGGILFHQGMGLCLELLEVILGEPTRCTPA
jgi:hypothetical protein